MQDAPPPIRVNRAPVLTLWAAVVAERLGHPHDTALTLGRAVAGSSARAKARSLGLVEEHLEAAARQAGAAELKPKAQTVRLLGRDIPVLYADDGTVRAADNDKPASAKGVQGSIARAFDNRLAVDALAASLPWQPRSPTIGWDCRPGRRRRTRKNSRPRSVGIDTLRVHA